MSIKLKTIVTLTVLFVSTFNANADSQILNIYGWAGEIPSTLIRRFEKQTHIKVHFSTFDSNETMYAKISTTDDYDLIMPSSYYVDRLRKEGYLLALDKSHLPNLTHLSHRFSNPDYDPHNRHSIPYVWGMTGIFYNTTRIKTPPVNWHSLWHKRYTNKLLLIDDVREVFSMALISLGYSPNDRNAKHIKEAYKRLLKLRKNIKLFSTNTIPSLMIDEDATIGLAWNIDVVKAQKETSSIRFILPSEGFVMWIDCLAIPKKAPHKDNAYRFINFMLHPQNAKVAMIQSGVSTTNLTAFNRLPDKYRRNRLIDPNNPKLKYGIYQVDIGQDARVLQINLWQTFKLSL